MTINNLDAFVGGLWDWGILRGCFGLSRIQPTDVDGLVEYNGYFLLLEAKRPGVPLKQGQRIMFEALQRTGRFTVVIVWGMQNDPCKLLVMGSKGEKMIDPADLTAFRTVVAQWYMHAHRHRKETAL